MKQIPFSFFSSFILLCHHHKGSIISFLRISLFVNLSLFYLDTIRFVSLLELSVVVVVKIVAIIS